MRSTVLVRSTVCTLSPEYSHWTWCRFWWVSYGNGNGNGMEMEMETAMEMEMED